MIKNSRFLALAASIFLLLCLPGCSATKAYQGPDQPDEKLALLTFYSTGFEYDISYDNKKIDRFPVDGHQAQVLPGAHQAEFTWSFETADDGTDTGLLMSWEKKGRCNVSFVVAAGQEYRISARTRSTGSWTADPSVVAQVTKKCTGFLCKDNIVGSAPCTYDGRSPSVFLDINLGN